MSDNYLDRKVYFKDFDSGLNTHRIIRKCTCRLEGDYWIFTREGNLGEVIMPAKVVLYIDAGDQIKG